MLSHELAQGAIRCQLHFMPRHLHLNSPSIFSTVFVAAICLPNSKALAAPCDMRAIDSKTVGYSAGKVKIGDDIELAIREAHKSDKGIYKGPIAVLMSGKEKCTINGGIFSNIYVSQSDRYLLTHEHSGSAGAVRIFDIQTCKQVDEKTFAGAATYSANQVVSLPYCEPIGANGKTGSCSSAHVFDLTGDECKLKVNEVASQSLTKKAIGLELPLTGVFTVREMKTSNARIVETKVK